MFMTEPYVCHADDSYKSAKKLLTAPQNSVYLQPDRGVLPASNGFTGEKQN